MVSKPLERREATSPLPFNLKIGGMMKLESWWFNRTNVEMFTDGKRDNSGLHVVGTCNANSPCKFLSGDGMCLNVDSFEYENLKGPQETCKNWEPKE
jgi:hypothetical protein